MCTYIAFVFQNFFLFNMYVMFCWYWLEFAIQSGYITKFMIKIW